MNPNNKTNASRSGRRPTTPFSTLALGLVSAVFLAACATTGPGGSVVNRAQERWEAIVAGDYETAYNYYSPGFRSSQSLGDFELSMRLRKVQYRGADYVSHECEGDLCTLQFNVQYHIASPVPGLEKWESDTKLDEKWVRTDGQWWYLPD